MGREYGGDHVSTAIRMTIVSAGCRQNQHAPADARRQRRQTGCGGFGTPRCRRIHPTTILRWGYVYYNTLVLFFNCFLNLFPISPLLDVYIDEKKQTYEDLGYRRFSWFGIWKAILSIMTRRATREVCSY